MLRKYNNTQKKEKSFTDVMARQTELVTMMKGMVIILSIISAFLLLSLVVVASYPKSQGYVIELTPDGEAIYNSDAVTLLEDWEPKSNTVNFFLRSFITQLRSVSSDPQIIQGNIDKIYRAVTGDAADKVTEYLRATDPVNRRKTETVEIKIASILPLSDTTYQIDFRETVWSNSRHLKSDTQYRLVAHTEIFIPTTREQVAYNPIGLYVTDFNITEVKEI